MRFTSCPFLKSNGQEVRRGTAAGSMAGLVPPYRKEAGEMRGEKDAVSCTPSENRSGRYKSSVCDGVLR